MATETRKLTFVEFDGFAGFLHGKQYELEVDDSEPGLVHFTAFGRPGVGPFTWSAAEFAARWKDMPPKQT